MNTTRHIKPIVTTIVAGALAIAAPAGASVLEPATNGWNPGGSDTSTSVTAISHPTNGDSSEVVTLRRDGSQATAFVADVGPQSPAGDGNGFDWGDGAIGAGTALLAATLLMFGMGAIGRRSDGTPKPGSAVSQGA